MKINRAYSLLTVKAADGKKRTITGIATTPNTDRMGDIVETDGIEFKLPLPLLYQHNSRQPIGTVTKAKVTKSGIEIEADIAKAGIAEFIDEAWALIKEGLVRGLSIGFRTLEEAWMKDQGGFRIMRSEWLELSAVTLPANADATILTVRSIDKELLAASGNRRSTAGSGQTKTIPGVSGQPGEHMNLKEMLAQWRARVKEIQSENQTLLSDSVETELSDENAKKLADNTAESKTLKLKIAAAEDQLADMATAVEVKAGDTESGSRARAPQRSAEVEVKSAMPKGHGFVRGVICLINAQGNKFHAAQLAKEHYRDTPEVELWLKATVAAGDTTTSGWASNLIPSAALLPGEFIELLRPATLIGRIPGLKRVPFNVKVPIETAGSTFGWVGESAPKPVSAITYSDITLRWAKAAGICVITKELARFSSPSAEALIKDSMIKQCAQFFDTQFIDETIAAVSNVSPASILNGKAAAAATGGTTAGDFRYDLSVAMAAYIANNQDPQKAVILLSAANAYNLSIMMNALSSSAEFPNLTINGGSIGGIPVVVSQSVGARLVVVNANDILFADDGGVEVSVSDQASVEMSSTPIYGEASPIDGAILQSFWQRNLIGIRVERFTTWARARTSSVEWISGAAYANANPA